MRFLNLFKVFFPSWKFFGEMGEPVLLFHRLNGERSWTLTLQKPQTQLSSLFLNARGNLYLASVSLVERLLSEASQLTEGQDASELISYRLVENLVSRQITQNQRRSFEFKIVTGADDALISSECFVE